MRRPMEGQQVVLAERLEGDVTGEHELVVALVVREGGEVERTGRQELGEGEGDPAGRVGQMLVGGLTAEGDEQVGDGVLGGGEIDGRLALDGHQAGLGSVGALEANSGHGSPSSNRQRFVR